MIQAQRTRHRIRPTATRHQKTPRKANPFQWIPGKSLLACVLLATLALPLPVPAALSSDPLVMEAALAPLLGIPYRPDGARSEDGRHTLFAQPDRHFASPGLNCSGLVLEAARLLINPAITLEQAGRDRLGDSGPGAPLGQDWDFGWDLIMNVAEGQETAVLVPGGLRLDPAMTSGMDPKGFALQDPATWQELLARMRRGKIYLLSFSKPRSRFPNAPLHYHVGLVLPVSDSAVWLYHTSSQGKKSRRVNLADPTDRAAFLRGYADTGKRIKRLLVLEVSPSVR